jgi:hypothetical protein
MGLAERRAAERFRNEDYPGWLARIEAAATFAVPVEVVWEELAVNDFADDYADFFPKVYFQPLVDALTAVTIDEMGTAAAREGIKKIIIRNTGQYHSTSGFTFVDGVVTLDHQPNTNVDYVDERAKGLQHILEVGL